MTPAAALVMSACTSGENMIDDPTEWDSSYGRLVAHRNEDALILTWSDKRVRRETGVDMVRFDPITRILTVFPKAEVLGNLHQQFDQVRELQLDTGIYGWDPDEPVGESDFFGGELELMGMPAGFGTIFAFGSARHNRSVMNGLICE
jgi:hypothetical protein